MKENNDGWTLTEAICVLVVMAVITIGGFRGYSDLKFKYDVVKMTNLVTDLAANVQTKYIGYPSYENISTVQVKDFDLVPADLKYNKAQALKHYLNGKLDVLPVYNEKTGLAGEYFAIRMQNLSSEMCFELGSVKWNNNMSAGLVAMEIRAKPEILEGEKVENIDESCAGIDADLFAAPNKGYTLACKNGSRQGIPLMPRYAWKACNCTDNTCMITWVYK